MVVNEQQRVVTAVRQLRDHYVVCDASDMI